MAVFQIIICYSFLTAQGPDTVVVEGFVVVLVVAVTVA
jgi:hypothetical protein